MYLLFHKIVNSLLYYTIRFEVLGVYVFSQTPFLLVYVFFVIFGFCSAGFVDICAFFSFLLVMYFLSNSLLLLFVCRTLFTREWVGKLIGVCFLEKYAPKKGLISFLILFFVLWFILGIEMISMQYLISAKFQQADLYLEIIDQPYKDCDDEYIHIAQRQRNDLIVSATETKGVINNLHSTDFFQRVHSFCSTTDSNTFIKKG